MTTTLPPRRLPTLAQVREARLPVLPTCPAHVGEPVGSQGCRRCFLEEDHAFNRSQDI